MNFWQFWQRFRKSDNTLKKTPDQPEIQQITTETETGQISSHSWSAAQFTPLDLLRQPRAVWAARYELSTMFWVLTFSALWMIQLPLSLLFTGIFYERHPALFGWIVVLFDAQRYLILGAMIEYPTIRVENYWLNQQDNKKPLGALKKRHMVFQANIVCMFLESIVLLLSEDGGVAVIYRFVAALPFDLVDMLSSFLNCLGVVAIIFLFIANTEYEPYERVARLHN